MINNILAEINRMNVSIIHNGNTITFRGSRAKEAIRRFKPHKQRIVDEVGKYHESKANNANQEAIDMARAIASAWSWSTADWDVYFNNQRRFDADKEVEKLFAVELEISPWRYECAE